MDSDSETYFLIRVSAAFILMVDVDVDADCLALT